MKTSMGHRSFDKLILALGIMVGIIAGINAATPQEPQKISAVEVKADADQEISERKNCPQVLDSQKIN